MKKLLLSFLLAILCLPAFADEITLNSTSFGYTSQTYSKKTFIDPTTKIEFTAYANRSDNSQTYLGLQKQGSYIAVTANPQNYIIESISASISTSNAKTTTLTTYKQSTAYTAPTAKSTDWSGIKVGDGINATKDKTTDHTITVNDNYFVIYNSTNNGQIVFSNLKINVKSADPSAIKTTMSFSTKEVVVLAGTEEIEQPILTVTPEEAEALVQYSSSDENIAIVDENNGYVMLTGEVGTATITAAIEAYEDYLESSASYTITVIPSVATLAEFEKAAPNKDDKAYMNCDLTVVAYKSSYCYVIDNEGNPGLIYKSELPYQVGDVIPAGWYGKASPYYGLYEIVPVGEIPAATTTAEVTYTTVKTISDADINKVLLINGVKLANEMPSTASNMNVTLLGGETIQLRNAMEIASQAAGLYDILAAVAIFDNTLQIYPIEFREYTDDRQPVTLTWSKESVEAIEGDSEIAVTFTATPVEIAESVTFDSSDEAIATYDKNTGKIVLTGKIGTTTITANFPGNDTYATAFASISVKIIKNPYDKDGYYMVDFSKATEQTSYGEHEIDGWKSPNSRIENNFDKNDPSKIFVLDGGKNKGQLTSPNINGAIIGIRFDYAYPFADTKADFKVTIKNVKTGDIAFQKSFSATIESKTKYSVSISTPEIHHFAEDLTSEYQIIFDNLSSSTGNHANRLGFYNIAYKFANPEAVAPEHSELHINNGAFADDDFEHLTDASYSGNGNWVHVKFAPADGHSVYFRFKNSQGEDINPEPADYRPESNDKANVKARATEAIKTIEGFTLYTEPFKLTQVGTLEHYTVNNETGVRNAATQIALSDVTGIEDITIDAAAGEAEYFNLQGVKVANPENGVFIVRHGNKISKQIIR